MIIMPDECASAVKSASQKSERSSHQLTQLSPPSTLDVLLQLWPTMAATPVGVGASLAKYIVE
eukprot:9485989-Pyramimonas_sp.AAC.1